MPEANNVSITQHPSEIVPECVPSRTNSSPKVRARPPSDNPREADGTALIFMMNHSNPKRVGVIAQIPTVLKEEGLINRSTRP